MSDYTNLYISLQFMPIVQLEGESEPRTIFCTFYKPTEETTTTSQQSAESTEAEESSPLMSDEPVEYIDLADYSMMNEKHEFFLKKKLDSGEIIQLTCYFDPPAE